MASVAAKIATTLAYASWHGGMALTVRVVRLCCVAMSAQRPVSEVGHVFHDGQLIKTHPVTLADTDLARLRAAGGEPARPSPATALPPGPWSPG